MHDFLKQFSKFKKTKTSSLLRRVVERQLHLQYLLYLYAQRLMNGFSQKSNWQKSKIKKGGAL
jgi:hypothetical protein